jgi:rod shape-determining protein MreC
MYCPARLLPTVNSPLPTDMAILDIRLRTGWLFITVAVAHLILISAQVNTKRGVPILEETIFGMFAEVQRAATGAIGGVRGSWENYVVLQNARRENEALRLEVAQLQIGLQRERALAHQSETLQRLLDLRSATKLTTTAAAVIAAGADAYFRTMTIDKGAKDGLSTDMAVIAPAGVVGRVIMPSSRAAKVQLLIDRNAAAAALVERSRAQGVVVGTGADRLAMEYVSGTADMKTGDLVVTSGIDGIYPKGFVIGQIESIQRTAGEFSSVVIRPAVEFSALEAVLVVVSPKPARDREGPD